MKNWFEKFMKIFLISIILVGLVGSIIFTIVKRNEGIPESESSALLKQEHIVTGDFSELSKIEGAELEVKEDKVIVTFYEKETKLEAVYDQEYNLLYSAVMHNRIYDNAEGVILVVLLGGFILPGITWLIVCCLIATIYDGIMAIKKKKLKPEVQNETDCSDKKFIEPDMA